eukprot:scaffold5869_cov165-Amphora_coffeaeformis.AAC.7
MRALLMTFARCLLSNTSSTTCLNPWSCCSLSDSVEDVEDWERQVHGVLTRKPTRVLGLSEHIRRGLLQIVEQDQGPDEQQQQSTIAMMNMEEFDLTNLIFLGLPSRPLYKVLALRLSLLCSQLLQKNQLDPDTSSSHDRSSLPASTFGLEEDLPLPYIPPPPRNSTSRQILSWIQGAGDRGVLATLGLRFTVGTDPRGLLPPSWSDLIAATRVRHKSHAPLSVAARARAKHAPRSCCGLGQEQQQQQQPFFGTVQGSAETQNKAAHEIIVRLLQEATWINIHTFGGTGGKPSLEVRVASGYGARWTADWSKDPANPTGVEFRGFLEPQMENGHKRGWKH